MDLSKQEMELFLLPIHLHSKNIFYHVLIRRASLTFMFYSLKIVITLIIWNKIVRPLVIINLWLAKHCVMFYSSFFSLIFSICTRPCTPAQYPLTLPGQGGSSSTSPCKTKSQVDFLMASGCLLIIISPNSLRWSSNHLLISNKILSQGLKVFWLLYFQISP